MVFDLFIVIVAVNPSAPLNERRKSYKTEVGSDGDLSILKFEGWIGQTGMSKEELNLLSRVSFFSSFKLASLPSFYRY